MPCYTVNEAVQDLTVAAIESVSDLPLILIDNASPMGGGYLRSKATTYVRNTQNIGYAGAVNQGIKLARTRYVAIVSTDVLPSPNWQQVAREVLSEPDTFSCHFRMTDYGTPFAYGDMTAYRGKERWCTAAFFVLNKQRNIYFDESFFNSYEDWDLFYRVRQKGLKTSYTNKACFQHHHSFTQKQVGFPKTNENREYFKKKHGVDPDELLTQLYPKQVEQDYYGGFAL